MPLRGVALRASTEEGGTLEEEKGIYLYCIVRGKPEGVAGLLGVDGENPLSVIQHRGVAAVVSEIDTGEFSLHAAEADEIESSHYEWIAARAATHERIVETIMRGNDLLPVGFATIVRTRDDAMDLLKQGRDEYLQALERLSGMQEWDVKVYADYDVLEQFISEHDPEIRQHEMQLSSAAAGASYLLRRRFETLVEQRVHARLETVLLDVEEQLRERSEDESFSQVKSPEKQDRRNRLALKASYLVKEPDVPALMRTLEDLSGELEGQGFSFEALGPWPPYSFVNVPKAGGK
jgi:hypothetical protein